MSTPPPVGKKAPPTKPVGAKAAPPPPPTRLAVNGAPAKVATTKTFAIRPWGGENEGEKVIIYGGSGMGKSSLAAMAPKPVFIGVDDGGRKIRDARNGGIIDAFDNVETFEDVRAISSNPALFAAHKTLVIDTATKTQELAVPYVLANYNKDGKKVGNLEDYGWGKGYIHQGEVMRLLLADCDILVRRGINVILLCQESAITVANAEGADYLMDGPKLVHNKQVSIRSEFCEWADHVIRIGFNDTTVAAAVGAKVGKVQGTDTTRVLLAQGARHFFAKSRTLQEPRISFAGANDDSLWQFMFPGEYQ